MPDNGAYELASIIGNDIDEEWLSYITPGATRLSGLISNPPKAR